MSIVQILKQQLPKESIIDTPECLKPFECDGLTAYKQLPLVAVLPRTKEHLRTTLRICRDTNTPVVIRGAGTGLSGGALPHKQGVLLVMTHLSNILEINQQNGYARVEPGVRNAALSQATMPFGLYYAPDPSSQIACSIGGNIAENSGGVHCLKYGLTLHNLLSVTMMTMDGEEVIYGGLLGDVAAGDLLSLVVGSEGLFGVFTEITVKLLPIPPCKQVMLFGFYSTQDAADAVGAIIRSGITPAGLEMMDKMTIQATEQFVHAGYPTESEALLICELDGMAEEVEVAVSRLTRVVADFNPLVTRVATSDEEQQKFWSGRKAALPTAGKLSPDYLCIDGSISRQKIGQVLARIAEIGKKYGLRVMNVFHAGDGNLHPLVLYDEAKGQLEAAKVCGGEILQACLQSGGTVTGEHGVGVEKLDQMCEQFNSDELRIMHQVKEALDPSALFNPHKAIPTLARCSELGGMHVHNGKLPFPDIERF